MSSISLASARGVTATWRYTVGSLLFFAIMLLGFWSLTLVAMADAGVLEAIAYALGSLTYLAAMTLMILWYRRINQDDGLPPARSLVVTVLLVGTAGAAAAASATVSLTLFLALIGTLLCMLPWQRGIRWRFLLLWTMPLVVIAWVEGIRLAENARPAAWSAWFACILITVTLPGVVVSMLWWWDIVRQLDSARSAESRLAAAQERLRLAGEVHDLQGHHLQVIALQLELAERLLANGQQQAALDHVRQAQGSVDDARDGTRDLASRFRGVPLSDELRNAVELLRAAGLSVEMELDPDADQAPRELLGPVMREATTNILKHGAGHRARLSLVRDGSRWRFRAQNDRAEEQTDTDAGAGAGLRGMTERLREAGGTVHAGIEGDLFVLHADVPEGGIA